MMVRKFSFAIVAAFAFAMQAKAADINVVENPVPANSFAECSVSIPDGSSVAFIVSPTPTKQVEYDNKLLFNGPAGNYQVTSIVFTIKDGKITNSKTTKTITIGKAPQPPPVVPDDPDVPVDAFKAAIQKAFTAEADLDKATSTAKLAALYRNASKTTVNDTQIKTNGALFDTMKVASRSMLSENAIPKVRAEIGKRLNPLSSAAATPIDRSKLAIEFAAIADALEAAK